jgi:hypothetical protein
MFHAAEHFRRRAAGEGQQQHAARIDAAGDECRHAMCQRRGFAGPRAGDDQQGVASVAGGRALLGIEIGEKGVDGCGSRHPCGISSVRRVPLAQVMHRHNDLFHRDVERGTSNAKGSAEGYLTEAATGKANRFLVDPAGIIHRGSTPCPLWTRVLFSY